MYLLLIEHASGYVQTVTFPDAFSRALQMILLADQPVTLRVQDPPVPPVVEVALVPLPDQPCSPIVDVTLVAKTVGES